MGKPTLSFAEELQQQKELEFIEIPDHEDDDFAIPDSHNNFKLKREFSSFLKSSSSAIENKEQENLEEISLNNTFEEQSSTYFGDEHDQLAQSFNDYIKTHEDSAEKISAADLAEKILQFIGDTSNASNLERKQFVIDLIVKNKAHARILKVASLTKEELADPKKIYDISKLLEKTLPGLIWCYKNADNIASEQESTEIAFNLKRIIYSAAHLIIALRAITVHQKINTLDIVESNITLTGKDKNNKLKELTENICTEFQKLNLNQSSTTNLKAKHHQLESLLKKLALIKKVYNINQPTDSLMKIQQLIDALSNKLHVNQDNPDSHWKSALIGDSGKASLFDSEQRKQVTNLVNYLMTHPDEPLLKTKKLNKLIQLASRNLNIDQLDEIYRELKNDKQYPVLYLNLAKQYLFQAIISSQNNILQKSAVKTKATIIAIGITVLAGIVVPIIGAVVVRVLFFDRIKNYFLNRDSSYLEKLQVTETQLLQIKELHRKLKGSAQQDHKEPACWDCHGQLKSIVVDTKIRETNSLPAAQEVELQDEPSKQVTIIGSPQKIQRKQILLDAMKQIETAGEEQTKIAAIEAQTKIRLGI